MAEMRSKGQVTEKSPPPASKGEGKQEGMGNVDEQRCDLPEGKQSPPPGSKEEGKVTRRKDRSLSPERKGKTMRGDHTMAIERQPPEMRNEPENVEEEITIYSAPEETGIEVPRCGDCQQYFRFRLELLAHLNTAHKNGPSHPIPATTKIHWCPECRFYLPIETPMGKKSVKHTTHGEDLKQSPLAVR